jgi:hypothetical protein
MPWGIGIKAVAFKYIFASEFGELVDMVVGKTQFPLIL